jgi:hypothetical protein
MEIKDYYSTLTNLGIKMLYQSDNLWRLQNPLDALNYISKDAYKILDEKFSQNLRNKYLNPKPRNNGIFYVTQPIASQNYLASYPEADISTNRLYFLNYLPSIKKYLALNLSRGITVIDDAEPRIPDAGEMDLFFAEILLNHATHEKFISQKNISTVIYNNAPMDCGDCVLVDGKHLYYVLQLYSKDNNRFEKLVPIHHCFF